MENTNKHLLVFNFALALFLFNLSLFSALDIGGGFGVNINVVPAGTNITQNETIQDEIDEAILPTNSGNSHEDKDNTPYSLKSITLISGDSEKFNQENTNFVLSLNTDSILVNDNVNKNHRRFLLLSNSFLSLCLLFSLLIFKRRSE